MRLSANSNPFHRLYGIFSMLISLIALFFAPIMLYRRRSVRNLAWQHAALRKVTAPLILSVKSRNSSYFVVTDQFHIIAQDNCEFGEEVIHMHFYDSSPHQGKDILAFSGFYERVTGQSHSFFNSAQTLFLVRFCI